MEITVILCTYNRCQSLANSLESLAATQVPESVRWQVLVVDNNSSDATRETVEGYCRRFPERFSYLFEPKPGKSNALNAGIQATKGQILAFVDDDVTVESTWLQNLTAPLHNGEWAGAGGRILPEQNFSPPSWIPVEERYALAPLALFDLGSEAGSLTEAPFGTNMAFRRKAFEKYGGFRTDLGPQPGSEIRSEDSEFGHRLLAAGEQLRYEPSAIVYHSVPQNRIEKPYFLAWRFDKGRAEIRTFPISGTRWLVAGIPLYLFRRFAVWTVRWMMAIESSRRFSNKLKVWAVAGQILECYRQSHDGKTTVTG